MDTIDADDASPDVPHSRKILIILGVAIVVFFFIINDLVGWIEGGGIFSIISAYRSARMETSVIDVDSSGLRTIFMIGSSLFGTVLSLILGVNFRKRLAQFIVIFSIIGGGFVLDAIYDEGVVESFMAHHGYQRCMAGDWAQGNGKSRVWFDDYVHTGVDCRKRIETIKERSIFG